MKSVTGKPYFFRMGQPTSYWDFQPSSKVMTAARGGMFFSPAFPGEEILHSDHRNILVLQLLHLRFKHFGRHLRIRAMHFVSRNGDSQK